MSAGARPPRAGAPSRSAMPLHGPHRRRRAPAPARQPSAAGRARGGRRAFGQPPGSSAPLKSSDRYGTSAPTMQQWGHLGGEARRPARPIRALHHDAPRESFRCHAARGRRRRSIGRKSLQSEHVFQVRAHRHVERRAIRQSLLEPAAIDRPCLAALCHALESDSRPRPIRLRPGGTSARSRHT